MKSIVSQLIISGIVVGAVLAVYESNSNNLYTSVNSNFTKMSNNLKNISLDADGDSFASIAYVHYYSDRSYIYMGEGLELATSDNYGTINSEQSYVLQYEFLPGAYSFHTFKPLSEGGNYYCKSLFPKTHTFQYTVSLQESGYSELPISFAETNIFLEAIGDRAPLTHSFSAIDQNDIDYFFYNEGAAIASLDITFGNITCFLPNNGSEENTGYYEDGLVASSANAIALTNETITALDDTNFLSIMSTSDGGSCDETMYFPSTIESEFLTATDFFSPDSTNIDNTLASYDACYASIAAADAEINNMQATYDDNNEAYSSLSYIKSIIDSYNTLITDATKLANFETNQATIATNVDAYNASLSAQNTDLGNYITQDGDFEVSVANIQDAIDQGYVLVSTNHLFTLQNDESYQLVEFSIEDTNTFDTLNALSASTQNCNADADAYTTVNSSVALDAAASQYSTCTTNLTTMESLENDFALIYNNNKPIKDNIFILQGQVESVKTNYEVRISDITAQENYNTNLASINTLVTEGNTLFDSQNTYLGGTVVPGIEAYNTQLPLIASILNGYETQDCNLEAAASDGLTDVQATLPETAACQFSEDALSEAGSSVQTINVSKGECTLSAGIHSVEISLPMGEYAHTYAINVPLEISNDASSIGIIASHNASNVFSIDIDLYPVFEIGVTISDANNDFDSESILGNTFTLGIADTLTNPQPTSICVSWNNLGL